MINLLATPQIAQELGSRLQRRRLELNLIQEAAALHSGLSRRKITSVEHGHGATLATVIDLLRALDSSVILENFLPNPGPSPLEMARLKEKPFRYNASKPRRKPDPAAWKWGKDKRPAASNYNVSPLFCTVISAGIHLYGTVIGAAICNGLARNQNDHTKNPAFLMDRRGTWSLAPAFDPTYAHNPSGAWTSRHQMSLAGKRDGYTMEDLQEAGRAAPLKPRQIKTIIQQGQQAVARWPEFAGMAGVPAPLITSLQAGLRQELLA